MGRIARQSAVELAEELLRKDVLSGRWVDLLPSSRWLAGELGVSAPTVGVALGRLADEGLVEQQGPRRIYRIAIPRSGRRRISRKPRQVVFLTHKERAGLPETTRKVLDRMVELMEMHGVSGKAARAATAELRQRCRFADHAADWDQLVSAAQLIGINLFNIHLAADELGRQEMVRALEPVAPDATLEDAAEALRTIPELAHPCNEILHVPEGPSGRCGRIAVMHAGGTNGGASVAQALFDSTQDHTDGPIETVLYIHLSGADAAKLEERSAAGKQGSVIVSGHFASDAIGLNMLLREAADRHGIDFVRHGGLSAFDAR